jgi:hypothetical protein
VTLNGNPAVYDVAASSRTFLFEPLLFKNLRVSFRKTSAHFRGIRARQVMMSSHRLAVSSFAALLAALAISTNGVRAQTTVTSEPPATFTLGNGLKVVVIADHRTPVVTQMIWYKVGSADETPGKSGLAHFSSNT